ncbi:MAG: hypothetical protein ABJH06_19240 [Paraglaciecola sp.]
MFFLLSVTKLVASSYFSGEIEYPPEFALFFLFLSYCISKKIGAEV